PGGGDEADLAVPAERNATARMKDLRVAAAVDHAWLDELDPDPPVHLDRRLRDGDRGVRELPVDVADARVGAVVEAPVEARNGADPVYPANAARAPRERRSLSTPGRRRYELL